MFMALTMIHTPTFAPIAVVHLWNHITIPSHLLVLARMRLGVDIPQHILEMCIGRATIYLVWQIPPPERHVLVSQFSCFSPFIGSILALSD